jgi:hypothetical protein
MALYSPSPPVTSDATDYVTVLNRIVGLFIWQATARNPAELEYRMLHDPVLWSLELVDVAQNAGDRLLEAVTDLYRVDEAAQVVLAVRLGYQLARATLGWPMPDIPTSPRYGSSELARRLAAFNDDVSLYSRDPSFELDSLEPLNEVCERAVGEALGSSTALVWIGQYGAAGLLSDGVLVGIKAALVEEALLSSSS